MTGFTGSRSGNLGSTLGITTQAKDFLQQKASAPLEDWVYGAEDQTTVALAVMLG